MKRASVFNGRCCLVFYVGIFCTILSCFVVLGCGKAAPKTPEETFLRFTHATLRNQKKNMKKYAVAEYIMAMESTFDMLVISAFWPALVKIEDSKSEGDRAVLKTAGVDRRKKRNVGVFELKKIDAEWKVVGGEWFSADGYIKDEVLLEEHTNMVFEVVCKKLMID